MAGNFDISARIQNDPEYRVFVTEQPLFAFSVDTAIQAERLERMASRLNQISDTWVLENGERIIHNYTEYTDLFWFWVLGAYEVVRTMSANKACFSRNQSGKIDIIKKKLVKIRVPFAKQELAGKPRNLVNPEVTRGRFGMGAIYEFDGHVFDSVDLITDFHIFVADFTIGDIINSMHWKQ